MTSTKKTMTQTIQWSVSMRHPSSWSRMLRPAIEARPGRVERYDTEYKRNGTRNLFMFCEPKGGWRHVEVTERRTAVDFAHQMPLAG